MIRLRFALAGSAGAVAAMLGCAMAAEAPAAQPTSTRHEQGLDPGDTAEALIADNHLIATYYKAGRYGEIEPLLKFRLAAAERQKNSRGYLQTSAVFVDLAELYEKQNRFPEAEKALRDSLTILKDRSPKDHLEVQDGLERLAEFYVRQLRFKAAEPLYRSILTARERVLGPANLKTLEATQKLARLLLRQGRYDEALELRECVRKALRQTVMTTAGSIRHNDDLLANLERQRDSFKTFVARRERDMQENEAKHGPDHGITLFGLDQLASFRIDEGHYSEAETLLLRALAARERTIGTDDPRTVKTVRALVESYRLQERYDDAHRLIGRYLVDFERNLGPDQALTLAMVVIQGDLYVHQQRWTDADARYRRVFEALAGLHGPDAKETTKIIPKLAVVYRAQARYEEAAPLFKAMLSAQEADLSKADRDALESRSELAAIYRFLGRHVEANLLAPAM